MSAIKEEWSTDDGSVRLLLGDARKVLPMLGPVDCIITDPVWPNAHPDLAGASDPYGLWQAACKVLPSTSRLCVWLGCQSDPRFLACVPEGYPFLRMCYLRRAVPSYNGRCLVSGDVLYAYGEWPAPREGRMVLPGECSVTSKAALHEKGHPCARNLEHAEWAVKWWSDPGETILDCFAGTGTTAVACAKMHRNFVGIEIDPGHYKRSIDRVRRELARTALIEPPTALTQKSFI